MMRREASPAMRFLDDLLNLNDGSNYDEWMRKCRQVMVKTFPPEDAFTVIAPQGVDLKSVSHKIYCNFSFVINYGEQNEKII
jgi:hypothetical protein